MLRITTLQKGARRPAQLRLTGPKGTAVHIDLAGLQLSDEQYRVLSNLFAHGDITRLNDEEKAALSRANAYLSDAADGPFIRFDLKIVRIDRAPNLNWEEIYEATLVEEI